MISSDSAAPLDADAFARLAVELHDADGFADAIEAVVQFALQAENCTYAGVALATTGGRAEIGAVTDPVVEAIYTAQINAGDGPMLTAMTSGKTVYIADVAKEDRWPHWQSEVAAAKIRSVLHVPMTAGDQVIGVLSLYTLHPDAFTADDERSRTSSPGTPRSRTRPPGVKKAAPEPPSHLARASTRLVSGKASCGQQPASSLKQRDIHTLSPVHEKPAGQVAVHLVSLGENALRDGDRQHRVMPDRVQEAVG